MKYKRSLAAGLLSLLCVLVNIGGKALSNALELPLWLDSFGTMVVAYIYGPVGGAIVGAATNIAFYIGQPVYWGYALTSVAVGVIVGWCARKRLLTSLFGVLTAGFLVTLSSVIISTPFNILFFGGSTGNKWGDGVIGFLNSLDLEPIICCAVGEFYVDFVDKVITVLLTAKIAAICQRSRDSKAVDAIRRAVGIVTALAFCTAVLPSKVYAYENAVDYNDYLRTVYNNENGLPGGTANDMAQTGDGVLWIGTNSGLYRYKGNDFELMSDFSSVKNVNCLCVDEEGRLWIGTNDKGLSICINNEPSNSLTHKDGLPSNSVRCIAESGSGIYYVGTTDALALVSLTNGINVAGVIPEITCAKSISVNGGYTAVVNDAEELYLLKNSEITHKISDKGITCCRFDKNGDLYVGTSRNSIEIYNINDDRLVKKVSISCGELSHFNSLELSETGEIMLCAENGAGYLDGNRTFHPIALGKFTSSIEHTLFDYQGNLWFTSSALGLIKFCRSPFTEIFTKTGLPESVVNAVTKWQGNFYFGTDSGLYAADNALSEAVENALTEQLRGVHIRCLMTDSAGNLWICTSEEGAFCADKSGNITVYNSRTGALSDKFRAAAETKDGTVLLAGDHGITYIKDGAAAKSVTAENGLINTKTLCLLEAENGEILAGMDGNGIAVIKNGSVERTLTAEDGLSSDIVMRIVPDDGGYFIVTSNSLCYMDTEYNIRVLENFPYYSNYDIIKRDDGMLFVTGSAGVYVIDGESLLGGSADHILLEYSRGLRISLTANSWNYADDNDTLYLCGGTGVVSFGLYEYSSSHRSYRMSLRHIEVDGEIYYAEPGEAVKIPRGANIVRISPDIVNYSINDPLVRIYLEGHDEKPQTMQLSALSDCVYANIPTGEYIFRMAVLDDKGNVVSENSYRIIKEKEIYDEPWFMVYFWAVFVTAIFYLAWMIFRTQFQRSMNIQKRELAVARQQVEMGNEAIITIAHTVDAKDTNTSEHSFRVSEYSVMIARKLGYDDKQCEELRKTALLHDIGKIGIPDSVLNKPAKLTDEEYGIMKTHVVKGAEILKHFTTIENIVEGAQYHHERYDGRGYMQGLSGEEIPLNARIIGIADAFDAMTANRVYRKQLDLDFVLSELKRCRGTQFDPKLTDIMLGLIEDGTIQVKQLYEKSKERTAE